MSERLRASPDVILTELGDETGVLLHLGTKFYYTLNSTCVSVWKALDRNRAGVTRADLAEELSRRFEVDAAQAAADLDETLAEMLTEGLVLRGP